MLDLFHDKSFAEEVAYLLINITGDRTRVVKTAGRQGGVLWMVERYTGTEWVRG